MKTGKTAKTFMTAMTFKTLTTFVLLTLSALMIAVMSAGASGETPRYWRIDNTPVLSEKGRDALCGAAKKGRWENIIRMANYAGVSVEDALALAECQVADATANPRPGNLVHTAIYYNGGVGLIMSEIVRYLLKNDPSPEKTQIFVNLVRGVGEQENIFIELNHIWKIMDIPSKRMALWKTAKMVCWGIDHYNVKGLEDIRENECRTEPFDFPPRAPRQ